MNIWDRLAAPFDPADVHFRPGATSQQKQMGLALAYIDARHVQERLDATVGPANWSDKYHQAGTSTICELSLRIDGEWITKSDGAGQTDVEGDKGAISDAFKRAAVKFGIGRYLYYSGSNWYPMEPPGQNGKLQYFTKDALHRMRLDLGAWQREWFKGMVDDGGEITGNASGAAQASYSPPQHMTKADTGGFNKQQANAKAAAVDNIDALYKEFMAELSSANATRRADGLPNLRGDDIKHELQAMNFNISAINNWNDLKGLGANAIKAIITELNNRPLLIGQEHPF